MKCAFATQYLCFNLLKHMLWFSNWWMWWYDLIFPRCLNPPTPPTTFYLLVCNTALNFRVAVRMRPYCTSRPTYLPVASAQGCGEWASVKSEWWIKKSSFLLFCNFCSPKSCRFMLFVYQTARMFLSVRAWLKVHWKPLKIRMPREQPVPNHIRTFFVFLR